MADYDSFARCTIGTTNLVVTSCKLNKDDVVREGSGLLGGTIGKAIAVEIEAFVTGATAQQLQDNVAAAKAALDASGLDFNFYENGLATPAISIIAARMIDGGPHFKYEVSDGGALRKNIRFTLTGQTARAGGGSGGGGGDTPNVDDQTQYDLKITERADSLFTYERNGELRGPNLAATFANILANFIQQYDPTFYTITSEREFGTFTDTISDGTIVAQGDILKYSMTAVQNSDALPSKDGNLAVEGTASFKSDRDEQHRMTETYAFDLLIEGQPSEVLAAIRGNMLPQGRVAQREGIEFTSIKERRLRASFVYLRSADGDEDGNGLMNWTQSFRTIQAADVWEEMQYPGLDPLLIKKPKTLARLVQSGSAIGAGAYPDAPPPLFPGSLLEAPEISNTRINDVERGTEWTYTMALENSDLDLAKLGPKRGRDAA
jgi:hypothetical protein